MKRLREKLKAIYYVITDSEYIVLTATIKNKKVKRCAALISDNVSKIAIEAAIDLLKTNK